MSENALPDRNFQGIFVEACRPATGNVGVKSGVKDRSQIHPLTFPGNALRERSQDRHSVYRLKPTGDKVGRAYQHCHRGQVDPLFPSVIG